MREDSRGELSPHFNHSEIIAISTFITSSAAHRCSAAAAAARRAEEVALHLPYLWCEQRSSPEPAGPARLFSASSRQRLGKERGDVFSLLSSFSPAFNSSPPSPMRPLPSLSFPLRAECVKQLTGTEDSADQKHRAAVKFTAPPWRMVSAETGPESRAARDQSERRHRQEGLRCFFSPLLSSNYPPIFDPSLALVSSALSTSRLLSPQPPSPLQPATPRNEISRVKRCVDGSHHTRLS